MPPGERWTPIYARLFDPEHELADEPVCKRFAWADLLSLASYESAARIIDGQLVPLRRGEFVASLRFLATRWRWDKMRVSRFFGILLDPTVAKLSKVRETPVGTVYRIVKYDTYANPTAPTRDTPTARSETASETPTETPPETLGDRSTEPRPSVENPPGETASETANETPTRQRRDKEYKGVERNSEGRTRARNGELSQFLGEFSHVLAANPIVSDPIARRTLFQHYGPPGLRANAWKRPDGTSVPDSDRPRILALAISGYASEGRSKIITNEFAAMLRRAIRDDEPPPRIHDFGDETDRDRRRAEKARARASRDRLERGRREDAERERERREALEWYESVDAGTRAEVKAEARRRVSALDTMGAKVTETTERLALLAAITRRRGEG